MILEGIAKNLIDGHAENVSHLTIEALASGLPAREVLEKGLLAGMKVVGVRFKNNDIFLPEVLVAARAMKAGMRHLEPILKASGVEPFGKCVIGTVQGDIHDIGKNLVNIMLTGAGFEVIDLGINVSGNKFAEAIQRHRPNIVAMSALLTTTMIQMKSNIQAFRAAGLLNGVSVLVGGAPVTRVFAEEIGANGYARDASEAVEQARVLLKRNAPGSV